ncbi:sigma-70 family RNA polymerase sigma factor [Actinomadura sp. 9N407]|uniref:sigma-70 family RNA polymerase sigma factor n=1 Tax=Actinomadura sp. 9N407 TaxID=3375154 RepID=UPI003793C24E
MKQPSREHDESYTAYVTARSLWLQRVAYLLCHDWQRSGDLVQTTVTQLYAHWPKAGGIDNLDGYTRTILVRAYLSEQRSAWWRRVSVTADPPDAATDPVAYETSLDLRAALAALPPRQRAAVVLRFYCDLTVERTAEELRCSPGTVKSQTSRALTALRRTLEPTALEGDRP